MPTDKKMSLDIAAFLKDYIQDVQEAFPEFAEVIKTNYNLETLDCAAECKFFETSLRPHVMKIIQKDNSLFEQPLEILRGVDLSPMWASLDNATQDSLWKYIRLSLAFSFFGGNSDQQIQSILGIFKQMWTQHTGRDESDIDGILNDEQTQSSLQELLEVFSTSKIASLITEMIETITPEQLGVTDVNLTDLEGLTSLFRDPNNPIVQRATSVITQFLDTKIQSGAVTKEELVAEIEGFKARLTGSFGRLIKETMVGPQRGDQQNAQTLMSNHPDARRARMLARLQRKQREKGVTKK
jgi:hypothetical protein